MTAMRVNKRDIRIQSADRRRWRLEETVSGWGGGVKNDDEDDGFEEDDEDDDNDVHHDVIQRSKPFMIAVFLLFN